jgi:hypothetical protein
MDGQRQCIQSRALKIADANQVWEREGSIKHSQCSAVQARQSKEIRITLNGVEEGGREDEGDLEGALGLGRLGLGHLAAEIGNDGRGLSGSTGSIGLRLVVVIRKLELTVLGSEGGSHDGYAESQANAR